MVTFALSSTISEIFPVFFAESHFLQYPTPIPAKKFRRVPFGVDPWHSGSQIVAEANNFTSRPNNREIIFEVFRPMWWCAILQCVRRTDGRTACCVVDSSARTRGAQLSAGYTVNTYSKRSLYDAIVNEITSGFPNALVFFRRRSIYSADRHVTRSRSDSTKLKAGNSIDDCDERCLPAFITRLVGCQTHVAW